MPIQPVIDQVSSVILGKDEEIRLALSCMLGRGHLLIEDLPGVGKTTLAHALAISLGLDFRRIQFTSDMLPADLIGVSVYHAGEFEFHPGPVFSNLILADEINRTTPKTQSALLEAMEEGQVTVEGKTRSLPSPFFVIATQNPLEQYGTFPLPESQLDRFAMRISLGYPGMDAERELLSGRSRREMLSGLARAIEREDLLLVFEKVGQVHASGALLDYVQALIGYSRSAFSNGLSPRAGLALLSTARAWAYIEGRDMVLPEDVRAVLPGVVDHRLYSAKEGLPSEMLLAEVPIP